MIDDSSESDNRISEFVLCSINPREDTVVYPPNIYAQSSFLTVIDVRNDFLVDDTALVYEKVPTGSGMFMWLTGRGCLSIYRMGFVPNGTQFSFNDVRLNPPQLGYRYYGFQGMTSGASGIAGDPLSKSGYLSFDAPLAVPYNSYNIPGDQVTFSPDLDSTYSKARTFAGKLDLELGSNSIGGVEDLQLNGQATLGSLSDSRYCSQNVSLQGANAFAPADIVQQSQTQKDGLLDVDIYKAVVTVMGPDIPPDYSIPDADISDQLNAQWTTVPMDPTLYRTDSETISTDSYNTTTVWSGWITPWATTLVDNYAGLPDYSYHGNTNGLTNPLGVQNINTGPINICGCLDIKLSMLMPGRSYGVASGGPDQCTNNNYSVTYEHVFISCDSTGALTWKFIPEYSTMEQDDEPSTYLGSQTISSKPYVSTTNPQSYMASGGLGLQTSIPPSDPKYLPGGFTGLGMYLGTQAIVRVVTNIGNPSGYTDGTFLYGGTVSYRPHNLYAVGELGPMRVIRYDNLQATKNSLTNISGYDPIKPLLRLQGQVFSQVIAQGALAPFVWDSTKKISKSAIDVNSLTFLSELYNASNMPFKRTWVRGEYEDFLATRLPGILSSLFSDQRAANPVLANLANGMSDFQMVVHKKPYAGVPRVIKSRWIRFYNREMKPYAGTHYRLTVSHPDFARIRDRFRQEMKRPYDDKEVLSVLEEAYPTAEEPADGTHATTPTPDSQMMAMLQNCRTRLDAWTVANEMGIEDDPQALERFWQMFEGQYQLGKDKRAREENAETAAKKRTLQLSPAGEELLIAEKRALKRRNMHSDPSDPWHIYHDTIDITDPTHLYTSAQLGHPMDADAAGVFDAIRGVANRASNIANRAVSTVSKVASTVGKTAHNVVSTGVDMLNRANMTDAQKKMYGPYQKALPGESATHLPGHNFTGPGTDVNRRIAAGVKPTNAVDAGAMRHDLAYQDIYNGVKNGSIPRAKIPELVRKADMDLLNTVTRLRGKDRPADGSANLVRAAMLAKMAGEKSGVISPNKFVGASGKFDTGLDNFRYRFRKLKVDKS
jgi:hypothetical protein